MVTAALVFAALAALLHVYIFVLESAPASGRCPQLHDAAHPRATFGTTAEEAETTKLLAFNHGFYNLFLAIVTAAAVARADGIVAGQGARRGDPRALSGDRDHPARGRSRDVTPALSGEA